MCRLDHNSELQDFTMLVAGLYQYYCMLRQIAGVSQDNAPKGRLINSMREWNHIHLPRVIIDDAERDQYGSNSRFWPLSRQESYPLFSRSISKGR